MKDAFREIELRKLDLNLLLVFSALMRERSVSRAADRLYLGASAVSMALGRLRQTFDDPLFVRVGATMEPTARAHAFWDSVAPALGDIDAAVRGAKPFQPANTERVFRFGAPDDLEGLLVPRIIARLNAEAPKAKLVVRHSDFRSLLGVLDADQADLMLSATPERGLEARHRVDPLYKEKFLTLYDRDQLGQYGPLTLETYLSTPHALLSLDGELHSGLDKQLQRDGLSRSVQVAVTHFPTIPHILKSTQMIANVPGTAALWFAGQYDLEVHSAPIAFDPFEVSLISHVRNTNDPAIDWFRELVSSEVTKLVSQLSTLRATALSGQHFRQREGRGLD